MIDKLGKCSQRTPTRTKFYLHVAKDDQDLTGNETQGMKSQRVGSQRPKCRNLQNNHQTSGEQQIIYNNSSHKTNSSKRHRISGTNYNIRNSFSYIGVPNLLLASSSALAAAAAAASAASTPSPATSSSPVATPASHRQHLSLTPDARACVTATYLCVLIVNNARIDCNLLEMLCNESTATGARRNLHSRPPQSSSNSSSINWTNHSGIGPDLGSISPAQLEAVQLALRELLILAGSNGSGNSEEEDRGGGGGGGDQDESDTRQLASVGLGLALESSDRRPSLLYNNHNNDYSDNINDDNNNNNNNQHQQQVKNSRMFEQLFNWGQSTDAADQGAESNLEVTVSPVSKQPQQPVALPMTSTMSPTTQSAAPMTTIPNSLVGWVGRPFRGWNFWAPGDSQMVVLPISTESSSGGGGGEHEQTQATSETLAVNHEDRHLMAQPVHQFIRPMDRSEQNNGILTNQSAQKADVSQLQHRPQQQSSYQVGTAHQQIDGFDADRAAPARAATSITTTPQQQVAVFAISTGSGSYSTTPTATALVPSSTFSDLLSSMASDAMASSKNFGEHEVPTTPSSRFMSLSDDGSSSGGSVDDDDGYESSLSSQSQSSFDTSQPSHHNQQHRQHQHHQQQPVMMNQQNHQILQMPKTTHHLTKHIRHDKLQHQHLQHNPAYATHFHGNQAPQRFDTEATMQECRCNDRRMMEADSEDSESSEEFDECSYRCASQRHQQQQHQPTTPMSSMLTTNQMVPSASNFNGQQPPQSTSSSPSLTGPNPTPATSTFSASTSISSNSIMNNNNNGGSSGSGSMTTSSTNINPTSAKMNPLDVTFLLFTRYHRNLAREIAQLTLGAASQLAALTSLVNGGPTSGRQVDDRQIGESSRGSVGGVAGGGGSSVGGGGGGGGGGNDRGAGNVGTITSSIADSLASSSETIELTNETTLSESRLNSSLPIKIIIHGFGSGGRRPWVTDMVYKLLNYEDANVIVVDWEKGAALPNYVQAAGNTRVVGHKIACLIKSINEKYGITGERYHLIGFSLGAHVAGFAGMEIRNSTSVSHLWIKRITGLDPASPLFEGYEANDRLDPSDAEFVDVIHSNGDGVLRGGFGSLQPMGHVDFYPNGGRVQVGCNSVLLSALSDIIYGKWQSLCNHRRALNFFMDSFDFGINKCKFRSFNCDSYDSYLKGECFDCGEGDKKCSYMGYRANKSMGLGKMYLTTHEDAPFCANQFYIKILGTKGYKTHWGKVEVTLIASDGRNESFLLSSSNQQSSGGHDLVNGQKELSQHSMQSLIVAHPTLEDFTHVLLRYTKYKGWIYSGDESWSIDKLFIMDSGKKVKSFCGYNTILESHIPTRRSLERGNCTVNHDQIGNFGGE